MHKDFQSLSNRISELNKLLDSYEKHLDEYIKETDRMINYVLKNVKRIEGGIVWMKKWIKNVNLSYLEYPVS